VVVAADAWSAAVGRLGGADLLVYLEVRHEVVHLKLPVLVA